MFLQIAFPKSLALVNPFYKRIKYQSLEAFNSLLVNKAMSITFPILLPENMQRCPSVLGMIGTEIGALVTISILTLR
jgi:hypothetical protein